MNDNSQQSVLVTVLFIPERKKRGRTGQRLFNKLSAVEKMNTLMQSPELRQKSYSLCQLPPDIVTSLKSVLVQERGERLLCVTSTYDLLVKCLPSSPFLFTSPPPVSAPSPSRMREFGHVPPLEQQCGRQNRCAGKNA